MSGASSWTVLNQSHSPAFTRMLGRLSGNLGPCRLLTGMADEGVVEGVSRSRGPGYSRTSLGRRLISWLWFMLWAEPRVLLGAKPTQILAVTNPPVLPQLAWLAGRLRGIPYSLIIWDLYPDHFVTQRWLTASNPVVRLWRILNRWAFDGAESVITLGPSMAKAVAEQMSSIDRMHVVPNWADVTELVPLAYEDNGFARAHARPDHVTVLYSGNMGASHGLEGLVDAMGSLPEDLPVEVLLIGDGLGRQVIEDRLQTRSIPRLKLMDYQPWEVIPRSLAMGDVAVVAQAAASAHLSVPSKTYSALAVGSAILAITPRDSDLGRLVLEEGVGWVCEPGDTEAIAEVLRGLPGDPDGLAASRAAARSLADRRFSESVVHVELDRLLGQAAPP
jgi:glycosyltransferase involved in cell wall biosynthesis